MFLMGCCHSKVASKHVPIERTREDTGTSPDRGKDIRKPGNKEEPKADIPKDTLTPLVNELIQIASVGLFEEGDRGRTVEWKIVKNTSLKIVPNKDNNKLTSSHSGAEYDLHFKGNQRGIRVGLIRYHTFEAGARRDFITSPYHCNCMEKEDIVPCAKRIEITQNVQEYINSEESTDRAVAGMSEVLKQLTAGECECDIPDRTLTGPQFQWDKSSDGDFDISFMKGRNKMYWKEVDKENMDIKLTNDAANKLNLRQVSLVS